MSRKVNHVLTKKFIAGGTIPVNRFVAIDSTPGQVIVPGTTGDLCVGVSLNAASSGEEVSVCLIGVAEVAAGAAVADGALVRGEGTSGKALVLTPDVGAATHQCGVTVDDAGAEDALCCVLLNFGFAGVA
jgi:hypothetical protein